MHTKGEALVVMVAVGSAVAFLLLFIFNLRQRRKKAALESFLIPYRRGDYDAALQATESLQQAGVSTRTCDSFRGEMLMQLGNLDAAEKSLQECVALAHQSERLNPRGGGISGFETQIKLSALFSETLGSLRLEQHRYDEAMKCFEASLSDWPNRGSSHRGIAETILRRGDSPAEALKFATLAVDEEKSARVLSQDSYDTNLSEDLATLAWAVAAASQDAGKVDRLVTEAIQLGAEHQVVPSLAQVQFQAGLAYSALGHTERSTQHLQEAARIDPKGRWGRAARARLT